MIVKVIEKEKFSLLRGEEEMLEKIKEMVAEQLNVDAADITEETWAQIRWIYLS